MTRSNDRKIVVVTGVCGGRPVLEGTRIEPRHIVSKITDVESIYEVMDDYDLTLKEVGRMVFFHDECENALVDLPISILSAA